MLQPSVSMYVAVLLQFTSSVSFPCSSHSVGPNRDCMFDELNIIPLTIIQPVYVQHFKCNIRDIRSGYPHIHKWLRNLYWNIPAFKDTTNFLHIKNHYTKSHTPINPFAITPVGPLPHILPLDKEVAAVEAAAHL